MKNSAYLFPMMFLLLFCGCTRQQGQLEVALEYSGQNRKELEKVLTHYSHCQSDSLKLEAARFLISNMPGHCTYTSPAIEKYYTALDSVQDLLPPVRKLFQNIPFDRPEYTVGLQTKEDIKLITAEYLIHHIDLAFRQWETLPWLEGLDFAQFKEYLLPYRVAYEPLDYWLDSVEFYRNILQNSIENYEDCRYFTHYMQYKLRYLPGPRIEQNPDKRLHDYKMDCIPNSRYLMFLQRLVGIPSAIDFIPHFANRNGRHYWTMTPDMKYNTLQVFQANMYRAPKIFRQTYSHNPCIIPARNEYVPSLFRNPFFRDVTREYMPVTDIKIDIPWNVKNKYVYLAVFNDLQWKPVACARVSGSKAVFQDMGRDIVYLPVYYDENETMYPLDFPFIVWENGETERLNADKNQFESICLTRKYPSNSMNDYWNTSLMGLRIEVSDDKNFNEADTIAIIQKRPLSKYQDILIDTIVRKRYCRLIKGSRDYAYLAHLSFYDKDGQKIEGKAIGPDSTAFQEISSDDPVRFGTIRQWMGLDFEKPVCLSRIRYLPRNDANGIFPGNEYELFYYDFPGGWKSLGIQNPIKDELDYTDVPSNALLWLRNLTTGQEERIFTYRNGRIIFW